MANKIGQGENARVVVQQCLSASLEVKPGTESNPSEVVQIGKGIVLFISFFKNAELECVQKIVKSIINVKLTESLDGKLQSVLASNSDMLIIPQACLAGRIKGTAVQYHGLAEKSKGETLYKDFVKECQNEICSTQSQSKVKYGTYGNRQVLKMNTNGPFTHVFDF